MPAKVRERDGERNKERDRNRDRDTDVPRPKDRTRHKSTRSVRKSSSKDAECSPTRPERSATITTPPNIRRTSVSKPELERRSSSNPATPSASKTSLPYPSFSKAHSKEAVGSTEDILNKRQSYYTPDPTDLDKSNDEPIEKETPVNAGAAPPSPPLTTDPVPPVRVERDASPHEVKTPTRKTERKKSDLQKAAEELKRRLGRGGSITSKRDGKTRSPSSGSRRVHRGPGKYEDQTTQSARRSKPSTPSRSRPKAVTVEEDTVSTNSLRKSASPRPTALNVAQSQMDSTTDSDATSIAPNQPSTQQPTSQVDTISTPSDDSVHKPIFADLRCTPSQNETPAHNVNVNQRPCASVEESPMPPPPPPPPDLPFQMPKVDYLLHHGGLSQAVSKSLLNAGQPLPAAGQQLPPASVQVDRFFSPFNSLLDDYVKVMGKSGSLAVATGYRSIARRLLDRLEAVFARDISSETCDCVMCQQSPNPIVDDQRGVSWGEILEYVCGRQELPQWPPFVLDSCHTGLGVSATSAQLPMQSLDVDVPEEYRDHYVRQSKKTKQAVDRWLQSQPSNPTSPPQDIDDETLTFAMLTRLDAEQRPIFSSLIGVSQSRPPSRAGTPFIAPRSEFLINTGLAIQRLYRLSTPPRDPESAIYLLSNPALHNILATLAAISDAEWEILISGRFDGFLRSGAEDTVPNNMSNATFSLMSNNITVSRGPTPLRVATPSMSGAPTPAALGAPVAFDEETEIATLAEIEREIYLGMEALEDAFEALHGKAETVRNALRQRGAGLAMANQLRRGNTNGANSLDARLGTPAGVGWESETDDGLGDEGSELAPDDSASNVSRSRRRRPGRRHERRTPAMVEEEDEDGD